ncbi:MAG: hypothetical protein OQK98_12805 [Gammaproteobacteria bacterium]|nr:hypothetical protein [Gammaproteobacteria bacterium]
MIETEQPEDDFVVECSWSSKYFSLHGGKSEVKKNVFVASSGESVDCGTSWRGDGPYVNVSHPLYMGASGCENRVMCDTPRSRMENDILIMIPLSKEKYLDELISKYEGDTLVNAARDYLAGNFPGQYLSHYNSVKKIKPEHFKQAYEKRLTEYWEKLLPIIQDDLSNQILRNYTV